MRRSSVAALGDRGARRQLRAVGSRQRSQVRGHVGAAGSGPGRGRWRRLTRIEGTAGSAAAGDAAPAPAGATGAARGGGATRAAQRGRVDATHRSGTRTWDAAVGWARRLVGTPQMTAPRRLRAAALQRLQAAAIPARAGTAWAGGSAGLRAAA